VATKAYCVKCKKKQNMSNEKEVTMKNGRKAVKGSCPACGTGMYSILPGASVTKAKPAAKKAPAKAAKKATPKKATKKASKKK